MTAFENNKSREVRIDPEAFFKELGLHPADVRPIMAGWREANARWRSERAAQIAGYANRVCDHQRRYGQRPRDGSTQSQLTPGKARPVWCVELRRRFASMSAAARFVGKKASNISQSINRCGRCGPYHWEIFDRGRHQD